MKYTAEELKTWWAAKCPQCGWEGLSRDCNGGNPTADTGDFGAVICPKCNTEVEDLRLKKYSIGEIKEWLGGHIRLYGDGEEVVCDHNQSLRFFINELDDPEDGIEAVTERLKK